MFETYKIKKLEREADINIGLFLKDLERENKADLVNAEKYIRGVKLKYISLKKKLKHNKIKILEAAIDWKDYAKLFLGQQNYTIARVNDEKGAMEAADGIQAKLEQIEKRFDKLLKD